MIWSVHDNVTDDRPKHKEHSINTTKIQLCKSSNSYDLKKTEQVKCTLPRVANDMSLFKSLWCD